MRIATIFAYLLGSRRAILEIASSRMALPVGALLVFSAALARNYDRVPLQHEPVRLLGPFVASLAISGPLFLCVYGVARLNKLSEPRLGRAYLAFLGLYWMTAPMAWLYGIPYERFLTPVAAVQANLRTLGVVSLWRVLLIIRVISVLFGLRPAMSVPLVLLVADFAALTALYVVPVPVIAFMGGISPEQNVIAVTALWVRVAGILTFPIWVVYTLVALWKFRTTKAAWCAGAEVQPSRAEFGPVAFAAATVLGWATLLPAARREQALAYRADQAYQRDGVRAALTLISAHEPGEFPPDWRPPPHPPVGEPATSAMLDILDALAERPYAPWVRRDYCQRFVDRARYDAERWPRELLEAYAIRLAQILTRLPEGPALARALDGREHIIKIDLEYEKNLTPQTRAALETLLRLAQPVRSDVE